MKVVNEFKSHHYVVEFLKSKLYCPNCGKQEVWEEQGGGDYYLGVDYICTSCGSKSHLDSVHIPNNESNHVGILEQLKSGVTNEPKTNRGR